MHITWSCTDLDHEKNYTCMEIPLYETQHTHLSTQCSTWHMQGQWLDQQSVPAGPRHTSQLSSHQQTSLYTPLEDPLSHNIADSCIVLIHTSKLKWLALYPGFSPAEKRGEGFYPFFCRGGGWVWG